MSMYSGVDQMFVRHGAVGGMGWNLDLDLILVGMARERFSVHE